MDRAIDDLPRHTRRTNDAQRHFQVHMSKNHTRTLLIRFNDISMCYSCNYIRVKSAIWKRITL
jgi:hypothetical protein